MAIKRRTFLQGCCAGIAAMSGAKLSRVSFAQTPGSPQKVIVSVFLRGGMDALNFIIPHGDTFYQDARPSLGLDGPQTLDIDGYFGLHPSAAALKELFDSQNLALIHATGIPDSDGTRSHFDAQDYLDYGGPSQTQGGWLARYLNSIESGDEYGGMFRGISVNSSLALSLNGFPNGLAMSGADEFTLRGSGPTGDIRQALRQMYSAAPLELGTVASNTLNAVDMLDANPVGEYTPRPGVEYPGGSFGESLMSVAQLIKSELGMQAATVDLGGWDTHESQTYGNPVQGPYADLVGVLANGLGAFWSDMEGYHDRVTIVVMSEFGRRLRQNTNNGTDHGHAGMMAVIHRAISEAQVFGEWPGLENENLYERQDLRTTTDFRTVLAEIFHSELGADNQQIAQYFPGFTDPGALGFLQTQPAEGMKVF